MSTITTRSGKGSPLTNAEVDANFTNLNNDKVQVYGTPVAGQAIVWDAANNRWILNDDLGSALALSIALG